VRIIESSRNGLDVRVACGKCGSESVQKMAQLKRYGRFVCATCCDMVLVRSADIQKYWASALNKHHGDQAA
jgi:hypothetical protein